MVAPVVAAAGIGAAGSIIGGVLSKSKKPRTYGPGEVLRKTVGEARELGIHPLAALGTVSPYSSSPSRSIGPAVADAAGHLARGVSEISRKKERAQERDAANRLLEAQVAEINSATALNQARTGSIMEETARSRTNAEAARNNARQPRSGYGVPEDPYVPALSLGDDKAANETILGVPMPFDAAQRNEDAGGDILGEMETVKEWLSRAFAPGKARDLMRRGHVCVKNKSGQWICSKDVVRKPYVSRKPEGFRPR